MSDTAKLPTQEVDFDTLRRELADEFNYLIKFIRNQDFDNERGTVEIAIEPLGRQLNKLRTKILYICGLQAEGLFDHVLNDDFHLATIEDI